MDNFVNRALQILLWWWWYSSRKRETVTLERAADVAVFVCTTQAVTDDFTGSDSDVTEIVTFNCDGSESSLSHCQQLSVASSCVVRLLSLLSSLYCVIVGRFCTALKLWWNWVSQLKRRSDVALAVRHWQQWYVYLRTGSLALNGKCTRNIHLRNTAFLTFTFVAFTACCDNAQWATGHPSACINSCFSCSPLKDDARLRQLQRLMKRNHQNRNILLLTFITSLWFVAAEINDEDLATFCFFLFFSFVWQLQRQEKRRDKIT